MTVTYEGDVLEIAAGQVRGMDSQNKVRAGTHDWGVGATGVLLDGTDDDMVTISAGRINATVASGAYAANYTQLAVTITQTNDVSMFASWNELYITGGTITAPRNAASVWAHVEVTGTVAVAPSTSNYFGAVVGSIMTPSTFTNDGIMGAFIADSVMTTGYTNNAVVAAFVAHVNASHPTKANWPLAMYVDGADAVLGFGSGSAYEDGVKIVDGEAGDAGSEGKVGYDALMKCDIGGTSYYIAMYDAGSVTNE